MDSTAQYQRGSELLRQGRREEAKRWLVPLAEAGHPEAVRELAWTASGLAYTDPGYEAEAEHWLRREAEVRRDPDWLVTLAQEMRRWASGRVAEAEDLVAGMARSGSARAAGQLGYWRRRDGALEAAMDWYRLAIELGHRFAWRDLGWCLVALGRHAEAEALYRSHAEAGDVVAQHELTVLLHARGRGPAPRRPQL
ncbi:MULTISPECIES: hypothetical protein [Streptomyces]|uniref:Tetratricopeptide repeat protein n=1 Tax=Streptomyces dengpaensis TaxID=2049881 RepID=A0ABM6SV55_9ACTN|nr:MULTISPECIES: hypothetical protein [Streptomyces]AVH58539.1 hypothetical protein C4B68_25330 [Streptomyces dengpaensis]PIB04988.1 hypothetical protein B1C81_31265 [Streptomyces sp. HG99]